MSEDTVTVQSASTGGHRFPGVSTVSVRWWHLWNRAGRQGDPQHLVWLKEYVSKTRIPLCKLLKCYSLVMRQVIWLVWLIKWPKTLADRMLGVTDTRSLHVPGPLRTHMLVVDCAFRLPPGSVPETHGEAPERVWSEAISQSGTCLDCFERGVHCVHEQDESCIEQY